MSDTSVILGSDNWKGSIEYAYTQCYIEDQNFVIVLKQDEGNWSYFMFERAFFVHFWNKIIECAKTKKETFFDDIYGNAPEEEKKNEMKNRCRFITKLKDAMSYYVIKFESIKEWNGSTRVYFRQIGIEQEKKVLQDAFPQYLAQANNPETALGGTIATLKKAEQKQILRSQKEGEMISPNSLIAYDILPSGEIKFNLNKAILKILGYDIATIENDFVYKEFGDSIRSILWNADFSMQVLQQIGSQLK